MAGPIGVLRLTEQYLDSPSLGDCSERARLNWHRVVLATADAYGCFKLNPTAILAVITATGSWPGYTVAKLEGWMREYEASGMLRLWEDSGRIYGYWTGWPEHNRIDTRYRRSTPEPPQPVVSQQSAEMRKDAEKCGEIPGDSPFPIPIPDPIPDPNPKEFVRFWDAYPRKQAREAALKAWRSKKPPLDAILKALEWQRRTQQWQDGVVPHGATYINQKRWQDEPPSKRASREETKAGERSPEELEELRRRRGVAGA